jgi:hypothetical protein
VKIVLKKLEIEPSRTRIPIKTIPKTNIRVYQRASKKLTDEVEVVVLNNSCANITKNGVNYFRACPLN